MPQILDLPTRPGSKLGVWKIAEDPEELKGRLQWSEEDRLKFEQHTHGERSKHWLYSRVLLREMLNTDQFIDLQADAFGKPYLINFPKNLSISHSADMVAVMLSDVNCGMDIQIMRASIEKVAHKFISLEEWKYIDESTRLEQMFLFWCCKEALYKYYGRKNLEFRENLFLHPFAWSPEGSVKGHISKDDYFMELEVCWKMIENYLVVWTEG